MPALSTIHRNGRTVGMLISRRHSEKIIIITYERLGELSGFNEYASFASVHRIWVQAALEEAVANRERRWTESIAVGSRLFIERIKIAMGAMAKGRVVRPMAGAFERREMKSAYDAIFAPENCDIAQKRNYLFRNIVGLSMRLGTLVDL